MDEVLSKRRLFVTPDRLVIALLSLEVFLFLSERFRWFPFNEAKGLTAVISAASVGTVLVLMALWFAGSLILRWRFQFSVRSLCLLVLAVAISCGWLGVEREHSRRQSEIVDEIKKLGGLVSYDWSFNEEGIYISRPSPLAPAWLRGLLGDDFFGSVAGVSLNHIEVNDAWLEKLQGFVRLQSLSIRSAQVTDAAVEQLNGFAMLNELWLDGTQITDVWLENFKPPSRFHRLHLEKTKVTDAGLVHVKRMTQLYDLDLENTAVTDAGLRNLKGLTRLRALWLANTRITDAGLENLKGLTDLEQVYLEHTQVTDEGVKALQQALPGCGIIRR